MKHTKGPWGLYRDGLSVGLRSDHTGICEVWGRDGNDEEGRANAALIAAAPELLEALKSLCDWFDGETRESAHSRIDIARAAIAKAEGL